MVQIVTGLVAMTMLVLQDLSTLSSEHRSVVLASPVLRGVFADAARPKLEAALSANTAGAISKLDTKPATMVEICVRSSSCHLVISRFVWR